MPSRSLSVARATIVSLVLAALAACGGSAPPGVDGARGADAGAEQVEGPGAGRVYHYPSFRTITYDDNGKPASIVVDFLLYTPAGYSASKQRPLFVMVHGCNTTAEQQMYANLINELADSEGFIVIYPDNGGQCWRAVSGIEQAITRGAGGEADAIADMTRLAIDRYNVDPEQVYIIGMSSGAYQTAAMVGAYPDLYAAAGVMAGGGYGMNVSCIAMPEALAQSFAPKAVQAMGERARVVPFIALGGTTDNNGEFPVVGGCSRLAFIEHMGVNNLLTGGEMTAGVIVSGGRFALDSSSTEQGQVPGGYAWTREVWRDPAGCRVGERWIVDGMGHYWSGGSSDPQWAAWTDPKGPSATLAAWDFFRRYRKSDTGKECVETRPRQSLEASARHRRRDAQIDEVRGEIA